VILDALYGLMIAVVGPLQGALPQGHLTLPDPEPLGAILAVWDFYLPIKGPLTIVVGYFALFGGFLAWKVAVYVWRLLPFT
jgi:hypothetical protein